MQGVFTKFLQLWIPNKTDKGSVVTDVFEPNFTKLDQNAETTNETLTDLCNNKLDKGTYTKTAGDLKTEIDFNLIKNLGLDYGGELNNSDLKQAGKAYWDNTTRSIYKCLVDNNLNYPEATKYIAISNVDLLARIQSLCKFYTRKNGDLIMNISLIENCCIVSFFIEATNTASEFYFQTNGTLIDLFTEFGVKIETPFQGTIGIIQGKVSEAEKLPFYIRCNEDGKLIFVGNTNITGKHGTFGTICFVLKK